MAPINPVSMLFMFIQIFMAAIISIGTVALSGVGPALGVAQYAASGITTAIPAAVMALPGLAAMLATGVDAFTFATTVTGFAFGIADRSLTPLQLYRPFRQVAYTLSGIYGKAALIMLAGGPVLAVVLLLLFPTVQQLVDEAYCAFDVLVSYLVWIGLFIADVYNIVAPIMNVFGYYVYLYASQMVSQLLSYTAFFFTVSVRVVSDPASLICHAGDAPDNSCAGYQDQTIFRCVPAQLRCAVIELLRFGIDTLLLQIITSIPDIGTALWPIVHNVAWLYIDATTMVSQFLAGELSGERCSSTQTVCTLEFDTDERCCPDQQLNNVLCRFLAFSQFAVMLVTLLENLPIIGPIIQTVLNLATALATALNTYVIHPLNLALNVLIGPVVDAINVVLMVICETIKAIDVGNLSGLPPKPYCGWYINKPQNVIPDIPSLDSIISGGSSLGSTFGCGTPSPPPPAPMRRRMLAHGDTGDAAATTTSSARRSLKSSPLPPPGGRILPRPTAAAPKRAQPRPPVLTGISEWDAARMQTFQGFYGSADTGIYGDSWVAPWTPHVPGSAATAAGADLGGIAAIGVQHAFAAPPWKQFLVVAATAAVAAAATSTGAGTAVVAALGSSPAGVSALGGYLPPTTFAGTTLATTTTAVVAAVEGSAFASAGTTGETSTLSQSPSVFFQPLPTSPASLYAYEATERTAGTRSLLTVESTALDYSTGILHVLVEVLGGVFTYTALAVIRVIRWVVQNTAGQLGLICRGTFSNIILWVPEQLLKISYGYTPPPLPPNPAPCSIIGDILYPVQWVLDASFSVTCVFDAAGVITQLDGTFVTAVDDFDTWSNNLVLNFLNALPRAEQLLQLLANVFLNLQLEAPQGLLAWIYSELQCSSPDTYNPITNVDGTYRYGCLLHLLVPPVFPPLPMVSQHIDWGLTCISGYTNVGILATYFSRPGTGPGSGAPILCKCLVYETCEEKFPSGASVVSAFISGAIEWASAIVQGLTEDGQLAFSVVTLIDFSMPIAFSIPPFFNIDIVLRPVTLVPYAEDFLLVGLNQTNNASLARSVFPGGVAPFDTISVNAGAACVLVRFPAMVKDVIVGVGFLAIYAASLAIVAAYASIALSVYWALVLALFSFLTTLFLVISTAINRHNVANTQEDLRMLAVSHSRTKAQVAELSRETSALRAPPAVHPQAPLHSSAHAMLAATPATLLADQPAQQQQQQTSSYTDDSDWDPTSGMDEVALIRRHGSRHRHHQEAYSSEDNEADHRGPAQRKRRRSADGGQLRGRRGGGGGGGAAPDRNQGWSIATNTDGWQLFAGTTQLRNRR